jgi:hypothetical protein
MLPEELHAVVFLDKITDNHTPEIHDDTSLDFRILTLKD